MSSISQLRKEKQRANNKNNLKEVANICNLLGAELFEAGEYEAALREHREEANIFEALEDHIGVAIAHRRQGEIFSELQKWEEALKHQNTHLSLALKCGNHVEEQRAYATLGRTHMQRSEIAMLEENKELQQSALAESEKAFLKALGTCQKIGNEVDGKELAQMRCRVYHNLGLVVDLKGETTDAVKFVSQSLELCLQYDFTEDAFRSYAELSRMHLKTEKFEKALKEAHLSLKFGMKLQKKGHIADSHYLIAQIQLAKEDYLGAKKSCYKAYKIKHPDKTMREGIEKTLKIIVYICSARDEMSKPETIDETRLKYLDKIGDACATLGLYKQAIHFYEERLNLALKSRKANSFLAPIYTSLAQTYKDMKQFNKALDSFKKELELHLNSNPKEAIITLIEIAKLSENLSQNHEDISAYYDQALLIAKKSSMSKYEGVVIYNYLTLADLPSAERESLKSQLEELQSEMGEDFEFEPSDNEEDSEEEEIDLDYVDFSDSDEEVVERHPRRGTRISLKLKVNAIGESPLHQAVIKGNAKMVKRLLENNHPVNLRDNSGWLPIHEACNWGYRDIAEMLIDAGAWINDKGGKECSGTTPLHDAASNCHFEVVRLLVENGASVFAKNDEGNTPLDCLVKFVDQNNLSEEDIIDFDDIKTLLIERMERAGHKVPSSLKITKRNNHKFTKEKSSTHTRIGSSELNDETLPNLDYNFDSETYYPDYLLPNSQRDSATETYKTAMKSIGSHSRRDIYQPTISVKEKTKAPLLPEEEYVVDDWLIDDLEPSKKRKRDHCEFEYKEKSRSDSPECKEKKSSPHNIIPIVKKKPRQPKLTSMLKKTVSNNSMEDLHNTSSNFNLHSEIVDESDLSLSQRNETKSSNLTKTIFHNPDVPLWAPLCLQIRVLQNRISIPVAYTSQSNTISWLEEEVSKRYFQLSGVKRTLRLYTSKDEVLDTEDIISNVLSAHNRELRAVVTGTQDFDSMSVLYNKICRTLGVTAYADVSSKLRECESLGVIDFSRLNLRNAEQFKPILTSIQFQNIQALNINSCRLGDAGMMDLIQSLPSFPLIEKLQVQACSLTTKSFISLLTFLTQENFSLKRLTSFSLSYNDFAKVTFSNFLDFLSLSFVRELQVVDCGLSFLLSTERVVSNISTLYMNENQLGLRSLSTILSSCLCLTHFSIHGCIPSARNQNDPTLGSSLSILLGSGDQCTLQYLDISACNVISEDVDIITSYLYRCPGITNLNVSENPCIKSSSITNLLIELRSCLLSSLKTLNVHGIKSLENDDTFSKCLTDVIEKKATSRYPFVCLSLPNSSSNEAVKEVWIKIYKEKSLVKSIFQIIFLKFKE